MNKNRKGLLWGFVVPAIAVLLLALLPDKYIPQPTVTSTFGPEDTVTPTSTNTFFRARTIIEIPCRSGTGEKYELVTTLPQDKVVMVIGKDSEQADWLLVRWSTPPNPDCWIERKFVNSDDYYLAEIVPTPPEPTATTNPTLTTTSTTAVTVVFTPQRTFFATAQILSPAKGSTPQTDISSITSTSTVTPTHTPTRTATNTPTSTTTPTDTPSPSPTTPPPPPCSVPSAPSLNGDRNGRNVNLSWSSVLDATSYEVSRSENGGAFISIGTTSGTSMKDSIPNSTTYEYVVVAINSCGKSKDSNKVSITR
ncbi:MAG: hypothetical protein HXY42_16060 [Chloroflexi bacterium]|nr:hypothetical protein [Chloroflexota bacterium]